MFHRTRILTIIFSIIVLSATAGEKPIKALFVGNSYCDFHVIPGQVAKMFQHNGRPAVCKRQTTGGFSWSRHWKAGKAQQRIQHEEKWDFVVLQNHSRSALDDPDNFYLYGQKFIDLVKTTQARPVLYLTWARENQPKDQNLITQAYATLGVKNKVAIAPVGEAFKAFRAKYPNIRLHAADKSHPSMTGAYLSACVLYATLSGKSPVGLPNQIDGFNWVTKGKKLADIDVDLANKIQQVAKTTVDSFKAEQHALDEIPESVASSAPASVPITIGKGTIQINFGGKTNESGWNGVPGGKAAPKPLLDALGNSTSATIELHDNFENYANPQVYRGELTGETKLFAGAAGKTLFTNHNAGNETGGFKLKLDPTKSYTLKIWASRQGSGMRWARYIVKGRTETEQFMAAGCDRPAGNVSKVLTFANVKPDAGGVVTVTVAFPRETDRFKNLGHYTYLTGMIIQPE